MTQDLDLLLSDDELSALVDKTGLKPAEGSPFHGIASTSSDELTDKLKNLGALDDRSETTPKAVACLTVLNDPKYSLTLLSGSPERSDSVTLYSADLNSNSSFAGYRRVMTEGGEANHLSFPVSASELMELINDNMRLGDEAVGGIFNAELSVPGFLALTSLADSYQKESMLSTLDRSQFTGPVIEASELTELASAGLGQLDIRWTVSLLSSLCPFELIADEPTLQSGLEDLLSSGATIAPEENGPTVLTGDSAVFCDSLTKVPYYYAMRIGEVGGPASFMAALRAEDLIWLFEFAGTDPATGKVRLSNLTNDEFRETVEKNYLSSE